MDMDDDDQEDSISFNQNNNQETNQLDFRLLLTHSRYDQIEKELLKMFNERHHNNNRYTKNRCTHHHNHSLERSLFDIEEDLHKILLLLVKQLEMLTINKNKDVKIETPVKVEIDNQIPKSSALATSLSMVNDDDKFTKNLIKNHQSNDKLNDHHSEQQQTNQSSNTSSNPSSEYSKLCLESDERFRNKFNRLQSSSTTNHQMTKLPTTMIHYRLTKPDIDLVLDGNDQSTLNHQSHSKFVTKQNQLARFKHHSPLCNKITELHNQHQKSSHHHHHQQQQQTPQQIIKQIQSLIDELHLEHDWITKKLHHYQVQNEEILSENKTLAKMADQINLHNMQTLSEHLIHVMDHLYELHQLNKKHLRSILE